MKRGFDFSFLDDVSRFCRVWRISSLRKRGAAALLFSSWSEST
jgi:hypothetical protein